MFLELEQHHGLVGETDTVISNYGVTQNYKRKLALESDIKGSLCSGKSTDLTLESDCLGSNPGSGTYQLYHLGQINKPLKASVSSSS